MPVYFGLYNWLPIYRPCPKRAEALPAHPACKGFLPVSSHLENRRTVIHRTGPVGSGTHSENERLTVALPLPMFRLDDTL